MLDHFHGKQAKANHAARVEVGLPLLPPGKPMYIIDDAHESYDESMMWEEQFKDGVRDKNNHFLLVCVYGAASGRNSWGRAASQSATIQPESRIELLPHAPHMLQVRMVKEEVHEVIRRWAASRVIPIDCHESTFEFLWYETQGHPGVLKLVLEFINLKGLSVVRAFLNLL